MQQQWGSMAPEKLTFRGVLYYYSHKLQLVSLMTNVGKLFMSSFQAFNFVPIASWLRNKQCQ